MGELAGSNGLFGGTSIIDPDGFPFSSKQTAMLERLTPQAQGGPGESFGSSKEENNKDGPSEQDPGKESGTGTPSEKQDKQNFDKLEKEIKQKLSESKQFERSRTKSASPVTRKACASR